MNEGEATFLRYLMSEVAPEGILSVVADTWDFWNLVTNILVELKDEIIARDGKLVIRPDSGDPVKILTGYKVYDLTDECAGELDTAWNSGFEAVMDEDGVYREIELYQDMGENHSRKGKVLLEAEVKGLVECLHDIFGGYYSEKGYIMLDDTIGAIYGDAITLERQRQIGERLMAKGFAPQVVLGVGSYSFQMVTRDTHGSAVKATNVVKVKVNRVQDGLETVYVDEAICKDPLTDRSKKSKKGLLRVEEEEGKLVMYDEQSREAESEGLLQRIFFNGKLVNPTTLAEIRERTALIGQ
jgi:nicotinamide phosphoribosyltransferase